MEKSLSLRAERQRREARHEIFTTPKMVTTRRSNLGPPAEGRPGLSCTNTHNFAQIPTTLHKYPQHFTNTHNFAGIPITLHGYPPTQLTNPNNNSQLRRAINCSAGYLETDLYLKQNIKAISGARHCIWSGPEDPLRQGQRPSSKSLQRG